MTSNLPDLVCVARLRCARNGASASVRKRTCLGLLQGARAVSRYLLFPLKGVAPLTVGSETH